MKRCPKYVYLAVFAVFYAFLLMQFSKIFIYYDDYGYLSLSYGTNIDAAGSEYSLSQLLAFMKGHYVNSNGRLLYMFLYCFVHMLGGIRGVQIFMATAVLFVAAGVFLTVGKMLEGRFSDGEGRRLAPVQQLFLAAFICLLFGTFGIMLQRMGTYWYAASFIYVVPAVPFLAFASFLYSSVSAGESAAGGGTKKAFAAEKQPDKAKRKIPGAEKQPKPAGRRYLRAAACGFLGFLAGWSQEQWFVAAVVFAILCLALDIVKDRKPGLYALAGCMGSAAGGMIIVLSPAVAARMNSEGNAAFASLGFFEKLGRNIPLLMNLFFSGDNLRYLIFFFPAMILLGLLAASGDRKGRVFHLAFSAASLLAFAGYLMKQKLYLFTPGTYSDGAAILLLLYIAFCFAEVLLFYKKENQAFGAFLFTAAVLSVGSAAIVPEVPLRIFYPFLYLSWVLFGYLYGKLLLAGRGRGTAFSALALFYLAAVSVPNLRNIYRGYSLNYQVLMYDDAVFRKSAEQIKAGKEIDTIEVYELPDMLCKNEVVYDDNFSFMIVWMREYYDLPEEVEFDYRPLTGAEALKLR